MAITGFTDEHAKVYAEPQFKCLIDLEPGSVQIDLSSRINKDRGLGKISRSKEILGKGIYIAGQNTSYFNNGDHFLSFEYKDFINNETNKVKLWNGSSFSNWSAGNAIFPATKASGDYIVLMSIFPFYGMLFSLTTTEDTTSPFALSTYFIAEGYCGAVDEWQQMKFYDIDTEIKGALAANDTSPYFGKSDCYAGWYNDADDNMFVNSGKTWQTLNIDGFAAYPIRLRQTGASSFTTIPVASQIYLTPSILFRRDFEDKKISQQFKFNDGGTMPWVERCGNLTEKIKYDGGVHGSHIANIKTRDFFQKIKEWKLGKTINGKRRPFMAGYRFMLTPRKLDGSYSYGGTTYDTVFETDVPLNAASGKFNLVSVFEQGANGLLSVYGSGGYTTGDFYEDGRIYLSSAPTGQIFINVSNIPQINGANAIDSFTPVGLGKVILQYFTYDHLTIMEKYYGTSGFANTVAAFLDSSSYIITKDNSDVYCSGVEFFKKGGIDAIAALFEINNTRFKFDYPDTANPGKFYFDLYHPDMLTLFSITPKTLTISNDYKNIFIESTSEFQKNVISVNYADSDLLENNNIENAEKPYGYKDDDVVGVDYFERDYGELNYKLNNEITLDIGDLTALESMTVNNTSVIIDANMGRKILILKNATTKYSTDINIRAIELQPGTFINFNDPVNGLTSDDIAEVKDNDYSLTGTLKSTTNIGSLTAVKHNIGLPAGQKYGHYQEDPEDVETNSFYDGNDVYW